MLNKKNLVGKLAALLLTIAPLFVLSHRCVIGWFGEPEIPTQYKK